MRRTAGACRSTSTLDVTDAPRPNQLLSPARGRCGVAGVGRYVCPPLALYSHCCPLDRPFRCSPVRRDRTTHSRRRIAACTCPGRCVRDARSIPGCCTLAHARARVPDIPRRVCSPPLGRLQLGGAHVLAGRHVHRARKLSVSAVTSNRTVDSDTLRQGAARRHWKSCTVRPLAATCRSPSRYAAPDQSIEEGFVHPRVAVSIASFSQRAVPWFRQPSAPTKRLPLETSLVQRQRFNQPRREHGSSCEPLLEP